MNETENKQVQEVKGISTFLFRPEDGFSQVEGYQRFRQVKALFASAWRKVPQTPRGTPRELSAWMEKLGLKNREKFLRRLKQDYPQLRLPWPRELLELLGLQLSELHQAVLLDQKEFDFFLPLAEIPRYYQWRAMACIYPLEEIPAGLNQDQAIAFVQSRRRACESYPALIKFQDLKLILVYPRSHKIRFYRPGLHVEENRLVFSTDGRTVGRLIV